MEKKITQELLSKSYERLEDRAQFDLDFIFLTIVAAVICTFGFRMNSTSVIIGAMVLSPLLFVIVAIGASLFHRRWEKFFANLITLIGGMAIVVAVSFIVNSFFPTINASEITERIINEPLDYLFVAFFSGLAGTFAFFWPDIIEAVTGIAISVALVPPVVLAGIGLSRWDLSLLASCLEIASINILGIIIGSFIMIIALNLHSKNIHYDKSKISTLQRKR
ncbi:hypothetical protein BH10BAC1_BH10BAC1_03760 [soil metagenome]